MQRRRFLLGTLSTAVLWPALGRAQSPPGLIKKRVESLRWVPMAQGLAPEKLYRISARGLTRKSGRDPVGPDGDPAKPGGRHHHLPGAPEGALVARVGDFAFVVGARCIFQVPAPGDLEVVINTDARSPGYRLGDLVVSLTMPGPVAQRSR